MSRSRSFACVPALAIALFAPFARAEKPAPPAPATSLPAPATSLPAPATAAARLYLRADTRIARVAVQPESGAVVARCVAPCDAELVPGKYRLELDGLRSDTSFDVTGTHTARARLDSHLARRSASYLALDVGGVLGGTMLAIGAFGGPSWVYLAGGGTLLAAGGTFLLLYRSDEVSWSLSPGVPLDLDQPGSTPPRSALRVDRRSAAQSGLGLRISF